MIKVRLRTESDMESESVKSGSSYKSRSSISNRSDTSKPKTPESDTIRLKNTMEQIQQLENTIGGYDKLLSDPELVKMAVQYKKERMELLVSKLRTVPPVWNLTGPIILPSLN
ncbi:hypothetical protein TNIN_110401 [Trichonephila inaurata madagascariensis]|uniref:Uncharacterized protein n=1 Tax=Trichonephila inaurata madagascariensis TaxID=2747483 RepID=A0A8X7C043_9ARAC|nr:hypothetical protein TNIN_110401 [Trichonephila inaurata madagascariensis]